MGEEESVVGYTKTGRALTNDEAEKRRRNNAASARFRAKKKALEQNLHRNIREQSYRSQYLEARCKELEHGMLSLIQFAQSKGVDIPPHYLPPNVNNHVMTAPSSIPGSPSLGNPMSSSLPSPLYMTSIPGSPELGSPLLSTPSTPHMHIPLPPFLPFREEDTDPSNFRLSC
eukprot:NODE_163_length_16507_cov_1.031814.p11 type:complete len:172 gc:universal NODE_163_length_16507_cov_1.031814:11805-12320(+)